MPASQLVGAHDALEHWRPRHDQQHHGGTVTRSHASDMRHQGSVEGSGWMWEHDADHHRGHEAEHQETENPACGRPDSPGAPVSYRRHVVESASVGWLFTATGDTLGALIAN
jgi:hypothetical protein